MLNVPAWKTHRDRHRSGPGKTDPGDALAIAHVVLRERDTLGPALEPELSRAIGLLELQRKRLVLARTQQIQRLRHTWIQIDPEAESKVKRCDRKRELAKLKVLEFDGGLHAQLAARMVRELAHEIEHLSDQVHALDDEIAELLAEHGNPLADLMGAGNLITATVLAHAGDVRRFRNAAAFARFCGVAPIPVGSGQSHRHRLHRGGNRQLNAALYRIAIVQQRHHPDAQRFLERKMAEGKSKREARRALKRHLANAVYRRLMAWTDTCPAMST